MWFHTAQLDYERRKYLNIRWKSSGYRLWQLRVFKKKEIFDFKFNSLILNYMSFKWV